jgi:hypothetical protein
MEGHPCDYLFTHSGLSVNAVKTGMHHGLSIQCRAKSHNTRVANNCFEIVYIFGNGSNKCYSASVQDLVSLYVLSQYLRINITLILPFVLYSCDLTPSEVHRTK